MSIVETKPVTAEQYARLPDPEDGTRLELIRGEIQAVSRPNWEHVEIAGMIFMLIKIFLRNHPIGRVSAVSGVLLGQNPDTICGPDVSFMSRDRLPLNERINWFPEGAPDLCVEVVSPSNSLCDIEAKLDEYFSTGAKLVWVVQPDDRTVSVYRSLTDRLLLRGHDTIDGGTVLPGFTCQVAEFFA
jgi:Uma2 family endonuclease